MAKLVLVDAYVSIGGVDLSNRLKQVTLEYSAEALEASAMGNGGIHERLPGLKDWSLQLEFLNDYAAASVDATIFPLVGTQVAVILRPTRGNAVSATNPNYAASGIIDKYSPLAGSIGEAVMAPVSIVGTTALTRLTA